jgi:hypothetical protein
MKAAGALIGLPRELRKCHNMAFDIGQKKKGCYIG